MSAVLTAEAVSKRFRLQRNRPVTLKESAVRWLTGRLDPAQAHWALRDVSFEVERGTALGIIGHNGAGKSTLLRLLCGLGRPTRGQVRRAGQVSGLLDLGSGFHPDMTGRENITTGGLLMGLTKREVLAQQDEIIAFAELEKFIDEPVRAYSSGMYLRLAFATAMQFDPDVLLIDEVLAVGDTRFQKKCLDRLATFRAAGKTLILTSHVMEQVRALCDEVLVLEEGRAVLQGEPETAIRCYEDLMRKRTERRAAKIGDGLAPKLAIAQGTRQGTQEAMITTVMLRNDQGQQIEMMPSGAALTVELEYQLSRPIADMIVSLGVFSEAHIKCFEEIIPSVDAVFGRPTERGALRCSLPELPLMPGRYYVNVGLYPTDWAYVFDYHWQLHMIDITAAASALPNASGVVALHPVWSAGTNMIGARPL
ncbi:MAG TPA: ABC transporter ATP-binding protein [Roseiflexaceae bacterium]|nr:ABC transporter ATP-binding protein [Roseiflexaceae bacterium]